MAFSKTGGYTGPAPKKGAPPSKPPTTAGTLATKPAISGTKGPEAIADLAPLEEALRRAERAEAHAAALADLVKAVEDWESFILAVSPEGRWAPQEVYLSEALRAATSRWPKTIAVRVADERARCIAHVGRYLVGEIETQAELRQKLEG